jgi:hypothetical protein
VSRLQAANDCFQAWASHSGQIGNVAFPPSPAICRAGDIGCRPSRHLAGGLGAGRVRWTAGIRVGASTRATLMSLQGQHRGAPGRIGTERSSELAPLHIQLPAVGVAHYRRRRVLRSEAFNPSFDIPLAWGSSPSTTWVSSWTADQSIIKSWAFASASWRVGKARGVSRPLAGSGWR